MRSGRSLFKQRKNDKRLLPRHTSAVTRSVPSFCFPFLALAAALALLCSAPAAPPARAATAPPIAPPWGLRLGDPAARVEREVTAAGLRVTAKTAGEGGRASWTLAGFSQENLTGAKLHFDRRSRLEEVELQYGNPAWTSKQFDGFAAFFLNKLQSDYGPALLVERRTEPQGGVNVTIECHQWRRDKIRLRCIRFSAETSAPSPPASKKSKSKKTANAPAKSFHFDTVSLHYRLMR